MVSQSCIKSWSLNWECSEYREIKWKRGDEPRKRSHHLIASSAQSQWHITVTFEGSLHPDRIARADFKTRRQDLQNLCLCLDFDGIQLVDNTVTELLIKREHDNTPPAYENDATSPEGILPLKSTPHADSEYLLVLSQLRLCVREDPFRKHFPTLDCNPSTATKEFSDITKIRPLGAGVYEVYVDNSKDRYVYKEVDNPIYQPRDSQVLNQELRNLELFHGTKGIVQLVAAIISHNPYHTYNETYDSDQSNQSNETNQADHIAKSTPSTVLRGILLEYHPNGTLADALRSVQETPQLPGTWQRWAQQIAEALARIHEREVTHMDLKPSNILINSESNALLSDVSGVGGVTRDYLAPEMLDTQDPLAESKETRVCNDIWALGKIFMEMGDASSNDIEKQRLKTVAQYATADDPTLRPTLHEIISILSRRQFYVSMSSGSKPPSVRSPVWFF
jgi:hypothetical protein